MKTFAFTLRKAVVVSALITSVPAWAAEITKMSAKKGLVRINEGNNDGFKKGKIVCFFADDDTQVACGKVTKAGKAAALVHVGNAKLMKKLKAGMSAKLKDAGGDKDQSDKVQTDNAAGDAAASGNEASATHSAVRALYIFTLLPPVTYAKLTFVPYQSSSDSSTTRWQAADKAGYALFGGGAEGEFAINKWLDLAPGVRYVLARNFVGENYYNVTQPNLSANTTETSSDIGVWLDDYFFHLSLGSSAALHLGAGLDFDMSSLTLSTVEKDDNNAATNVNIGSATSKTNVISLRIPVRFAYTIGPVQLSTALNLMLPLVAMGTSASGNALDPATSVNSTQQMLSVLGHGKNTIGAQFAFSAGAQF